MGIQKQLYKVIMVAATVSAIALSIVAVSCTAHAYKRYELTFPNGTSYTETYENVPYQQSIITGTPLYLELPVRRLPIQGHVPVTSQQGNSALINPVYAYPYGRRVSPYRYQNLQTQGRFSERTTGVGHYTGNPAQGLLHQRTQVQSQTDSRGRSTQTRTNVTIFGQ